MRKILIPLLALIPVVALAVGPVTANEALVKGFGYPNASASPAAVATSTSSARTATAVTEYATVRLLCDSDTFVELGGSTVTATTSSKFKVVGGFPEVFNVGPNTYAAFILSVGTSSCQLTVLQ